MPQNDPILNAAQQFVESGAAPILGDDGKVVVQDIQQGGTFGRARTDDQGTYIEYFEPYQPPEVVAEPVVIAGNAARYSDPYQGEGTSVARKVYISPNKDFSDLYNSMDEDQRNNAFATDESFRKNLWNASAMDAYSQSGVTNQSEWEFAVGGIPTDVETAQSALSKIQLKEYDKINKADQKLQSLLPDEYRRLGEIEDKLLDLESTEMDRNGAAYLRYKRDLENEYRAILSTPVQTEQGEVLLGNTPEWRQRIESEQKIGIARNSFWQVYEGSDEHKREQFYQEQVKRASDDLEKWYENYGAAGYYANLAGRKVATFLGSTAGNLVGLVAATPLLDLVGAPEARDAAEEMATYFSIASRAVQGDVNSGSGYRYEYALDDNRTAVVDADGQLLSIENINGFNLMRNMNSREIDRIQRQVLADRSRIYEDFSWGRQGSEVVDVGLYMVPILAGAGGIGKLTVSSVLKATGKEMLEKGTKMAIYSGASAVSAFVNTLGQNYASAIEQGLNRENATKLALTQSAIEGLAMSVIGGLEARTAMLLSGATRNQAAKAIRGYLSGYYSLDGVVKRLGKVGIQVGKDVVSETVEEVGVEWGQGLAATNYGLENHFSAQDVKNVMGTTVGLTLLMGFGLGTYRRQFRDSRDAPTLDDMGQWRAQLVDKVMTNMDSVERLAKTIGASAGLTPEQVNQKVLQLRHAKQQYDALPSDMPLEKRAEYISNVIEIETIKESLPNLDQDRILWEKHLSILERRNRQILGLSPKSSPVSDAISKRAEELGEDNEVSASAQDVQVPPPPIPPTPAQQPNDLASDPASDQAQPEVETTEPQEIDNFIAEEGNNILFEQFTGDIVERMDNAEDIPLSEIESSTNALYSLWDNTDTNENLSPEQKERIKSKIENVITKLENYEFATETETVPATTRKASRGVKIIGTKKKGIPSQYEVTTERIDGKDGYVSTPDGPVRGKYRRNSDGSLDLVHEGGTIPIDSQAVVFRDTIQDESGTVTGVILRDRNSGNDIVINDHEIALDAYIKHREQTEGLQEDPLFEEVFEEVVESEATTRTVYPRIAEEVSQESTPQPSEDVQEQAVDTQEPPPQPAEAPISEQEGVDTAQQETTPTERPNTSSYTSNTGKEIQVQQAEDGNWYRVKTDGSLYKNPITNQDYLDQIEENMSEQAETASEDQTTALLSLAPLYSTKVTTEEQAKALINSEMFKKFVENVKNIAKQLGVEVVNINTGVGAFEGVGEVTSAWEVKGNFEDIVELAAIVGGLSPEVQDSTIAAREVEPKTNDHNADMYTFDVEGDANMVIKALSEVGFDDSGYTFVGNKLYIYDVHEYRIEDLRNKLYTLKTKIATNGGKIEESGKTAVQSVYIDASQRSGIIRKESAGTTVQQTDGESLHNARIRAMERTKAFLEWRERINKPSQPSKSLKEYVKLRAKQLGLGIEGKTLSDAERARLKELESEFVVPLNKYFAVDESLYEAAKKEVEAIADEVASLVRDTFVSKFPIKKPARAAIKTVRWYTGQPNLLGDGSRTNIIVSNDADADVIFEELKRRYSVEGITRNEQETTELGYPKRLIEVLTPSGKIAEIQVMTPKGYLAKDGVKYFPKDQKSFARKILEQVREAVGFEVPDGVGHYFYEIDRDTNVPIGLRKRAVELSNIYYSLFTENPPSIDEARFKQDLQNFVNDVESADKSKWDDGNDAKTPIELSLYLNNIFDKQGNINYGKVEEISDGIEQGQGTIGELSLQEEKGRSEGGRTNVEASVILRGDRQANQAQYSGEPEAIAERQEALLEQYAKEKGVWLDESEIEESSTRRLPSGQEASVWLNEDKDTVTKAIDYSVYSENLEEFLTNRVSLYNHLLPDTALQVVGFTKTDGKFKVVVSQPFIQGQMLAPEGQTKMPENEQQQLDKYMADTFGMERRGTTYFNSEYVIDDVHGGNVIKSDGKYYFIDVVPSLNEPADGLGGNRQYRVEPTVERVTPVTDSQTKQELEAELREVNNISNQQARSLSQLINTVYKNIAKRLNIPLSEYRRKIAFKTVTNLGGILSGDRSSIANLSGLSPRIVDDISGVTEVKTLFQKAFGKVDSKYTKNNGLAKNDYILSALLNSEESFNFLGFDSKLSSLGSKEAIRQEIENRLKDLYERASNSNEFYIQEFTKGFLESGRDRAATQTEKDAYQLMLDGNEQVIEQQIQHVQELQRNNLLGSLNYLFNSTDYSSEFKYLMAASVLRGNISKDRVITHPDGSTKTIEGSRMKRNNKTVGLHQRLSPMVLPAVYRELTQGGTEHPMKIYGKNESKGFLSLNERASIAKDRIVKSTKDGHWIRFEKSNNPSDIDALQKLSHEVQKVMEDPTDAWCTGGGMAATYLPTGDFYLFVDNNYVPQITIRYEGDSISELKGTGLGQLVTKEQNLTAEKFLPSIPNGENYLDQVATTKLWEKYKQYNLDPDEVFKNLTEEEKDLIISYVNIETYDTSVSRSFREVSEVIYNKIQFSKDESIFVLPENWNGDITYLMDSMSQAKDKKWVLDRNPYFEYGVSRSLDINIPDNISAAEVERFFDGFKSRFDLYIEIDSNKPFLLKNASFESIDLRNTENITLDNVSVKGEVKVRNSAKIVNSHISGVTLARVGSVEIVNSKIGYVSGFDKSSISISNSTAGEVIGRSTEKVLISKSQVGQFTILYPNTPPSIVDSSVESLMIEFGGFSEYDLSVDSVTNSKITTLEVKELGNPLSVEEAQGFINNINPERYRESGLWDEEFDTITQLRQDDRAAILKTKESTLVLLDKDNADVTSPIHEIAHEYEDVLTDEEVDTLEQWSGHKKGTTDFSESFARGAELYIYEGPTHNGKVDSIFERFAQWFKDVIENAITYFDGVNKLTPEVRDIYSKMLIDNPTQGTQVERIQSLEDLSQKMEGLKGAQRVDTLKLHAKALSNEGITAKQIFEAIDKKIPLNQIEQILAEAALTTEGQPKTATSNNISKVARALGIGTKSKIKEGGKVVNVIRDKNGNWKRVDKKGNIIDAPLTREQIVEANSNTSNLFQISDIDMLIEHGLIEKKDC